MQLRREWSGHAAAVAIVHDLNPTGTRRKSGWRCRGSWLASRSSLMLIAAQHLPFVARRGKATSDGYGGGRGLMGEDGVTEQVGAGGGEDGVSESQFSQVLNVELNQIIKAYQYMDQGPIPKFTVIIAQKNHHTKLFQENAPDNVPPGTVVDSGIVHPRQYDFYMCAHAGPIGTSRPTHYHVLHDEIGFLPDDVQKLVLSLSYVYQRSTTAISVVAPICYAHLAAAQMGQFMKFEEFAETSSGSGGVPSSSGAVVPELPRLHADVCSSMFRI
uniref:Piwi domain-containing protein n=1 Tax=Oryza glumipatula TaxID=40148 RepID=A0A0E0AHX1_9ORYZ